MNTQITSSGYQYFIMDGESKYRTKSDFQSVTISNSFTPWITDYRDSGLNVIALRVTELTLDYFKRKTPSDNVEKAKLDSKLKRLCYLRADDKDEIKTFYVASGCSLPKVTHILLDLLSENYCPIKIVNMNPSLEKKLLKDLEKMLNPQGDCIIC